MPERSSEAEMLRRMESLNSRVAAGEEELRPLLVVTVQAIQGVYEPKAGPWEARQPSPAAQAAIDKIRCAILPADNKKEI